MAWDTIEFTTSKPSRRNGETFTEVLTMWLPGPDQDIVIKQPRIGHGTTLHILGPDDQKFIGTIRVNETDFGTLQAKHIALMAFARNYGVVVISGGTTGDDSSRTDETHNTMFLESISPATPVQAGNEYVRHYTLAFTKLTRVVGVT